MSRCVRFEAFLRAINHAAYLATLRASSDLPYALRVRAYAGRRRMRADLRRLLTEFGSKRLDEALRSLGFSPPAV
jgi:hypothetical protein